MAPEYDYQTQPRDALERYPDFRVVETRTEEYWDGPDGPYTRKIATQLFADQSVWLRREYWIDKARDVREVWFVRAD